MLVRLSFLLVSAMLLTSALLRVSKPAPPSGGLLVVANQKEHTLLLVDPDNRRELAKIVVGVNGHEVMASKDGRFAYVPIYGNSGVGRPGTDGSTVDVIDLRERKLAATIDLGKPLRPHRAELGPDESPPRNPTCQVLAPPAISPQVFFIDKAIIFTFPFSIVAFHFNSNFRRLLCPLFVQSATLRPNDRKSPCRLRDPDLIGPGRETGEKSSLP
jgi:hypothetical protein